MQEIRRAYSTADPPFSVTNRSRKKRLKVFMAGTVSKGYRMHFSLNVYSALPKNTLICEKLIMAYEKGGFRDQAQ
jgi:hypothetical protein